MKPISDQPPLPLPPRQGDVPGVTRWAGDLTRQLFTYLRELSLRLNHTFTDDNTGLKTIADADLTEAEATTLTDIATGGTPSGGDVVGPSSAVDGRIAVFSGTTGKLIKDSGKQPADFATAAQGSLADSSLQSITAGSGISVDSTDPANPVVTAKSMVVRTQVFSASGTYTPNANMLFCVIEAVGAGGGGGGVVGTAGSVGIGSGGGAGGYSRTTASKSTIGSSKSVTIGAGGTGGTGPQATVAGSGGDTSVGTLCIAKGGGGGIAANGANRFAAKGGVGGVAGTGDFTASGEAGCGAFAASISTVMGFSAGTGGSGMFGTGGPPVFNNDGSAGTGYGAGGGGGIQTTTANQVGGAGASGVVIITEYCSE